MPDAGNRSGVPADAVSVYKAWLRGEESLSFEELRLAHPGLSNELSALHDLAQIARSVTVQRSLRDAFGDEADLKLTIEDELETAAGGESPVSLAGPIIPGHRYQVQGEVARGGMGVIYRVRDRELNRTLAMKVMLQGAPGSSSKASSLLTRFMEEVQLTAQLDHPGIVSVHELGVDGEGRPYFTMKLVKGRDLADIFKLANAEEEGWNLSRAIGALIKACQAVGFAHSKGVIHRDLKPANVMAGRFGEVYVMDWGLAKLAGHPDTRDLRMAPASVTEIRTPRSGGDTTRADSPLITMEGAVVGTPAYMPPEQAAGQVDQVDAASDVYSLGAILYTLLAQRPPYVEPGARVSPHTILAMVLQGPPTPIHLLNPKAPAELAAICEKAMSREKRNRYPSSVDLAEDLQAWLDHRVVKAYRTGPAAELKSWVVRNRVAATVGAAALGVLFLVAAWWMYAEHVRTLRLRERLAQQYLRHGQALCENSRIDHGLHWFVRALKECPESRPGLRSDIQQNLAAWSERCNQLVQIFDHESALGLPGTQSMPLRIAFNPDGTKMLTGGTHDRTARLWSVATGEPIGTAMKHAEGLTFVSFAHGGSRIVTHDWGGAVSLWTGNGDPLATSFTNATYIALDQVHSVIATGHSNGVVHLWSPETGRLLSSPVQGDGAVSFVAFTRGGERMMAGWSDSTVRIWNKTSGAVERTIENVGGQVWAMSEDGTMFVSVHRNNWRLWSWTSGEPIGPAVSFTGVYHSVKFSPDGSLFVISNDTATQLWPTRDASGVAIPLDHRSGVTSVAFSPDGLFLLTGSLDFSARLWSMPSGKPVANEIPREGPISSAVFRPGELGAKIGMAIGAVGRAELLSVALRAKPAAVYTRSNNVWAIDFDPQRGRVVTGDLAGSLTVWSRSGEPVMEYENGGWIWDARFSLDGKYLLAGYSGAYARLWRTDEPVQVAELKHSHAVRSVAFDRSETLAGTGTFDGLAKIWKVPSGELVASLQHSGVVEDLEFSRDGQLLVTACSDGKVRFWSLETRREAFPPLVHSEAVLALEFSPDGRWIATGSRDRTARFWDARTRRPVGGILEHGHWVEDVAFSPDGQTLATGCVDGKLQLWSTQSGERIGPALPHAGAVRTVRFSPDGKSLLSASEGQDTAARLWQIPQPVAVRVNDLEAWVQSATGQRMDGNGVLSRLSPSEWRGLQPKVQKPSPR